MSRVSNSIMKISSLTYISVGIGGMLGASLRYFTRIWVQDTFSLFPWATFTITLTGAFLLSFLLFLPVTTEKVPTFISPVVTTGRLVAPTTFSPSTLAMIHLADAHSFILTGVTTGLLGAYTTFSTFTLEMIQLAETHLFISLTYMFFSIIGGLGCSFIGYKLARLIPKGGTRSW